MWSQHPLMTGAGLHQHPGSFALFRQEVLGGASVDNRGMSSASLHCVPVSFQYLSPFVLFLSKPAWEVDVPKGVSCPPLDMDALSGGLWSCLTWGQN